MDTIMHKIFGAQFGSKKGIHSMASKVLASSLTGKVQIEAFGVDLDGRQFIEQTRTVTVTRDGATIALANKLATDSELIVRNPATNEEAIARVVDLVKNAIFVQVYAIAFIDPSVDLWQIGFPEVQSKKMTVMECNRCHSVDAVLLSEIEMEILELKQTLGRPCDCSNSSTIWKQTGRKVTDRRATEREVNDRRRKIPAHVPRERRRERRTAMKASACIRFSGEEVVVECEYVSRGGFRFKSRKTYPAGMPFEVAVPYLRSSFNIFVTAQIAYKQELSGGFYRHGVAYMKSIKTF